MSSGDMFNDPTAQLPEVQGAYRQLAEASRLFVQQPDRMARQATRTINSQRKLLSDIISGSAGRSLDIVDAARSELSLVPKTPDSPQPPAPQNQSCQRIVEVQNITVKQLKFSSWPNGSEGCVAELTYTLKQNAMRVSWQHENALPGGNSELDEDRPLTDTAGTHTADVWVPANPNFTIGYLLVVSQQFINGRITQCVDRIPVTHDTCGTPQPPQPPDPPQPPEPPPEPKSDCCIDYSDILKCICDAIKGISPSVSPEPPIQPTSFTAWFANEKGSCYVLPTDEQPMSPEHVKIGDYPSRDEAKAAIIRDGRCVDEQTGWDVAGPVVEPVPELPRILPGCDPAAYRFALDRSGEELAKWQEIFRAIASGTETLNVIELVRAFVASFGPFNQGTKSKDLSDLIKRLFVDNAEWWSTLTARVSNCASAEHVSLNAIRMVLGMLEKWVGPLPPALMAMIEYSMRAYCPYLYPTTGQANQAYLANAIDLDLWQLWARQNGNCPEAEWSNVVAGQTKFSALQLFDLYRRGGLTRGQLKERIRETGFLRDSTDDEIEVMLKYVPGPSDLTRFMVRDVADQSIVNTFGLDAEFDAKIDNDIMRQMDAQGVDIETMRQYWRAHWDIPSNTQLFEMFHRNRLREKGDPLYTDQATIATALAQNDVLPFWRDRLLSISYNPLGRIDTRRAFEMGVINEREVFEAYVAQGYDDRNAGILRDFTVELKNAALDNAQEVKDYENGLITLSDANERLKRKGFTADRIDKQLRYSRRKRVARIKATTPYRQWVEGSNSWSTVDTYLSREGFSSDERTEANRDGLIEIDSVRKAACSKGVHESFIRGELDADQAILSLTTYGIDYDTAEARVGGWKCELASMPRDLPASYVKQAWELGLTTDVDAVNRLTRLGFSPVAAREIVSLWTIERQLKLSADAAKLRAEEEKRLKKEQDAQKKAQAKEQRQNQKRLDAANRLEEQLEKLRLSAAKKARGWATAVGLDPEESEGVVAGLISIVNAQGSFSLANVLRIAIVAIERATSEKSIDIESIAVSLATEADFK